MSSKPKLHVIAVSTRPGRAGFPLATWMHARATEHAGFEAELVDLREVALPMFDEPQHPRLRKYEHDHTKRWSAQVEAADAFVFVAPEYNHGPAPSLVNALTFLSAEWAHKPVGFVSYGGIAGGTRGVALTKPILAALSMVVVNEGIVAPFFTKAIDASGAFQATPQQADGAKAMLDSLVKWVGALAGLRG